MKLILTFTVVVGAALPSALASVQIPSSVVVTILSQSTSEASGHHNTFIFNHLPVRTTTLLERTDPSPTSSEAVYTDASTTRPYNLHTTIVETRPPHTLTGSELSALASDAGHIGSADPGAVFISSGSGFHWDHVPRTRPTIAAQETTRAPEAAHIRSADPGAVSIAPGSGVAWNHLPSHGPRDVEDVPTTLSPVNPPDLSRKLPKLTLRRRPQAERRHSNPPPPTPKLPAPPKLDEHVYQHPSRRILSERDHKLFLESDTHNLIVSFVFTLSDFVRDSTVFGIESSPAAKDPAIIALLAVLDEAEERLKRCPPLDTGSRFGNPAFRDFLAQVDEALPSWHQKLNVDDKAIGEVSIYLAQSFGNGSRIDYGSGHELNFLLWLLCLRQLSLLPDSTFPALVLIVFPRYLRLMRDVQSTYYLEPAGSHGVWGLDDYQFPPFLFGASQLVDHRHIRPLSIHNQMVVDECSKNYLYLDQIKWVNATKTVQGLRWHSPMLDDISSAKSWTKVEAGMRRMFLAEVLGKLPVAQHFLFGSLLLAAEGMSTDAESEVGDDDVGEVEVTVDGMKHKHNANSWGDCCGIKVPSAVGARTEAMKRGEGAELRRLPFD
ncbi:Serine/threonine-protein phosphatase 2A activator 2 [Friedmanniomyces endolithicus]|nr:Serine/threonine-protein phosphatase 2A activator 2 [Friedmanniomyces endolithicus]